MEKVAKLVSYAIAFMVAVSLGYGLYQQSQLYPLVHQQIGYNRCVQEVTEAQKTYQEQQAKANPPVTEPAK